MERQAIESICKRVNRLLAHHDQVRNTKGELFNVFSILNMETKENAMHSAFLAELLFPKGSHNFGSIFLELFLQVVEQNDKPFRVSDKAVVIKEKNIGRRNDVKGLGGRIDIYIKDIESNTICIENKIHARDQDTQIIRYSRYNSLKNTVYYLTLYGDEPSKESRGKLISGEDYYNISYVKHILEWLLLCLKEATSAPILRESIKQYMILIKKLAKTLNIQEEQELSEVIFDNLEEVKYITMNYEKILNKVKEQFRLAVFEELKTRLDCDSTFNVVKGKEVQSKGYSQLWIKLKKYPNSKYYFGVESFNGKGHYNGNLFVGIFKVGGSSDFKPFAENKLSGWWPIAQILLAYQNESVNLSNNKILKLIKDSGSKSFNEILVLVCNQIVDFIENYEKDLLTHLESNKDGIMTKSK